jgi:hypothetical protein
MHPSQMNGTFEPDQPEFAGDNWNITCDYVSDELFHEGHEIIHSHNDQHRGLDPGKLCPKFMLAIIPVTLPLECWQQGGFLLHLCHLYILEHEWIVTNSQILAAGSGHIHQ